MTNNQQITDTLKRLDEIEQLQKERDELAAQVGVLVNEIEVWKSVRTTVALSAYAHWIKDEKGNLDEEATLRDDCEEWDLRLIDSLKSLPQRAKLMLNVVKAAVELFKPGQVYSVTKSGVPEKLFRAVEAWVKEG